MDYPQKTAVDERFYQEHLAGGMPDEIFDVHVHLNLSEHIPYISQERIHSDWAFECGLFLTAEEALKRAGMLFGDTRYHMAGFPWPIREANLEPNNRYLLTEKAKGNTLPFMGVKPDWDAESVDARLTHFCGFKPYPDFVAAFKGAENSIFDFMPHAQLAVLNRQKKAVVIHLPRRDRLADHNNIRELLEMRQKYPDISIIIAHLGRSFCPVFLKEGLEQMGGDAAGFHFDTAAVINPAVYRLAFERLDYRQILYGTDAPIMYWHGKRTWTERKYHNLCRENYSWNKHTEGREVEERYTFILYEQLRAILESMEEFSFSDAEKRAVFSENARTLLHF
jgi:hypothetical protein